jgi:hypothetical protein
LRNVKVVSFNSSTVDAGTVRLYHGRQQVIQFDQLDCRFMAGPGKLIAVANLDGIMEYAGSKLTELNFKRLNDLGWKTGKQTVELAKPTQEKQTELPVPPDPAQDSAVPRERIIRSESGEVVGIFSPLTRVIPENIVDGDELVEEKPEPVETPGKEREESEESGKKRRRKKE